MGFKLGLGISIGATVAGVAPSTPSPSILVEAASSIVAVPSVVVAAKAPLTIVSSKSSNFFYSGDLGATVSAWSDQSGNARTLLQASGGAQPTYSATGLNGRGTFTFDGVAQFMASAYTPPLPGTTPSWYWMVVRPITITNGRVIAASAGRHALSMSSANRLFQANTTASNFVTATAAWQRVEYSFTNSTADYVKCAATLVTGGNAANVAAAGGFVLGAASTVPGTPANFEIACWGSWNGKPTAGEIAALDAWATSYYGGSLLV